MAKLTEDQQLVLNAIHAFLNPKLNDYVRFALTDKYPTPITIHIRNQVLPEESKSFFENLSKLYEAHVEDPSLIARIIADNGGKKRKSKTVAGSSIIKYANQLIKEGVSKDFSDIEQLAIIPVESLNKKETARLLIHVWWIWNKQPGKLRASRLVSYPMLRGYHKLRDQYEHSEIIEGIENYGRWAQAYLEAIEEDPHGNPFWFYKWNLKNFMISNKAMDHVAGSWKEVAFAKNIPSKFAHKASKGIDPEVVKRNLKFYRQIAQVIVDGDDLGSWHQEYKKNQEIIDKMIEEIRSGDAS